MGHELLPDWQQTVEEFTFLEGKRQEARAKECGCGNCKVDYQDAIDREDWLFNLGSWEKKSKVFIKRKLVIKHEDDEWYEDPGEEAIA